MRRCIILLATAIALWGCGNSDEGKKGDEAAQPSSQAERVEKTADGQQRVYIHGEKEREARELAMKNGLTLDDASSNMLEELYAACAN